MLKQLPVLTKIALPVQAMISQNEDAEYFCEIEVLNTVSRG